MPDGERGFPAAFLNVNRSQVCLRLRYFQIDKTPREWQGSSTPFSGMNALFKLKRLNARVVIMTLSFFYSVYQWGIKIKPDWSRDDYLPMGIMVLVAIFYRFFYGKILEHRYAHLSERPSMPTLAGPILRPTHALQTELDMGLIGISCGLGGMLGSIILAGSFSLQCFFCIVFPLAHLLALRRYTCRG